jgi:hypothetical protein
MLMKTTTDSPTDDTVTADELDALHALHGRIVDTLAGFDKMVETAEPAFRPVAEAYQKLHRRHAEEVAQCLAKAGQTPDADGSFMGSVNRAVVATRALFDAIDADVLSHVRSGEGYVLNAFDDAIGHTGDSDRVARLRAMRRELTDLLAATT